MSGVKLKSGVCQLPRHVIDRQIRECYTRELQRPENVENYCKRHRKRETSLTFQSGTKLPFQGNEEHRYIVAKRLNQSRKSQPGQRHRNENRQRGCNRGWSAKIVTPRNHCKSTRTPQQCRAKSRSAKRKLSRELKNKQQCCERQTDKLQRVDTVDV